MVDPIGPKGSTPSDLRVAPVAAATPALRAVTVAAPQGAPVGQFASELAAQPPVDTDRIARIKQAIADGTFPILPATIADRLLSIRYDWMSHDAA